MKDKNKTISTGNVGEYYVAAELERRGYSVAVPMSNVPTFDLLAIDRSDYSHQIAVQVKTSSNGKARWMLSKKDEDRSESNFYYVLVTFKDSYPEFYIVPAKIISERIKDNHQAWLATPSKCGQLHQDQNMREFRDDAGEFKDRWDLLK